MASELDNTSVLNPNESLLSGNQNIKGADNCTEDNNKLLANSDHEENDFTEYEIDVMTSSYGEISYFQDVGKVDESPENRNAKSQTDDSKFLNSEYEQASLNEPRLSLREKKRPNSLVLKSSSAAEASVKMSAVTENLESWKKIHRSQQTSDSQTTSVNGSPSFSSEEYAIYSPGHQRTGSDTSGLSDLQGTITVEGDMVSFVAEDLQEKIRLSSPLSKWTDSSSYPGSHCSTPSLYKQALQPQIPLIDAGAVADLEVHARKVASCVDTMLENLSGTLQSISSLTVDYMETYENAVCKTCDSVDISIKTMYQLVAKCEELGNTIKPLYKVSQDIKDIKRALTYFESVMEHKSFGRM